MKIYIILLIIALSAIACEKLCLDEPKEFSSPSLKESNSSNEVLQIELSSDSEKYETGTFNKITLSVIGTAEIEKKEISVSISNAVFSGDTNSQKLNLGDDYKATFYVRSSKIGFAPLSVTIDGITYNREIEFIESQTSAFVKSIQSDLSGTIKEFKTDSLQEITFTVEEAEKYKDKQIALSISETGTFANNAQNKTAFFDSNGMFKTFVKSSSEGIGELTLTIDNTSINYYIQFIKEALSPQLTVSMPESPVADGETFAEIDIQITGADGLGENATIDVSASLGVFSDNTSTVTLSAENHKLYIKSSKSGISYITIKKSWSGESTTYQIPFNKAEAEFIRLSTDSVKYLGNMIKLQSNLYRSEGSVSEKYFVEYSVSAKDYTVPGVFINETLSDENGTSLASFILQDTAFKGQLTFTSTVKNGEQPPIQNSTIVLIE